MRKWNPSLKDYQLVALTAPRIDHFTRRDDGNWLYHTSDDLTASLTAESIGCTLKLAEVYDRIVFLNEPVTAEATISSTLQ